jgi:hypothetical protein
VVRFRPWAPEYTLRGSSSVEERRLAKAKVAGSNPVFRSN